MLEAIDSIRQRGEGEELKTTPNTADRRALAEERNVPLYRQCLY